MAKDEDQDLSAPRLAVEFAETMPTWRFREDFWHQKDGVKVQQEKEGILSSVYRFVASRFGVEEAEPSFVKQVVESLKQHAFIEGAESPPFWIGGVGPKDALVGKANIMDFSPLFYGGEVRLLPHDPQYFATGGCDYAFDFNAQCPEWLAFQQWQWGDDDEMRDFIEEWLAYCLLQSMQLQTFLFVVGEGSNGKSVLASVFDAVLGRTNVSHVPIEDLGKQFSLYSTIGKLGNVISDAELTDTLIESRIKSFTSGDPMRCDRKYRDALDALVATARVIAFGNAVPLFRDTSRAIMRRLRIAHTVVSVKGIPDRRLAQKLYAERAGILNRVIVAAKRLIARGEFAVPSACEKAEQEFWLSNNSTRMWLSEHTCLWSSSSVPTNTSIRFRTGRTVWASTRKPPTWKRGSGKLRRRCRQT